MNAPWEMPQDDDHDDDDEDDAATRMRAQAEHSSVYLWWQVREREGEQTDCGQFISHISFGKRQ